MKNIIQYNKIYLWEANKQSGAVEVCLARNLEVGGTKPHTAKYLDQLY